MSLDVDRKISARIERSARWGPFAYWVTFTYGMSVDGCYTWTRAGAERKARRVAASLKRKQQARDTAWDVDLT